MCAVLTPGCHTSGKGGVATYSPYPEPITIAVAPVLNFSGEFSLDPVKAADLLASELTYVEGMTVLPVSRVVAVLAGEGKDQIESPHHALRVADRLGADAIVVAGVTEYDPYTPVVGLVLQLYRRDGLSGDASVDVVALSRQLGELRVMAPTEEAAPVGQIQRVYHGEHDDVVEAVRAYAAPRDQRENRFGWRQYLKVQGLFLRFCWHDAIERLLEQQRFEELLATDYEALENPA